MRKALIPLSWFFALVVRIRNLAYDVGIFRVHRVAVPVVSVGNLTAGGTGKTPFVEFIVRSLLAKGMRVAVLSRGYKRKTSGTQIVSDGNTIYGNAESIGDEPCQIATKFPSAIVIVDEHRARGAAIAVERYRPHVIVLDDGFQHRSLKRDLDIVMIDGKTTLSRIPMIPAGIRREPISSLGRANICAVSFASPVRNELVKECERFSSAPVIEVRLQPTKLLNMFSDRTIQIHELRGKACVGFCGIGNPASFRRTLEEVGLHVMDFLTFPDHHGYTSSDLMVIRKACEESRVLYIITTEKDAVRLRGMQISDSLLSERCFVLEIESSIVKGRAVVEQLLNNLLDRGAEWSLV